MIRPSKHSHPDKTLINIALFVLVYMKKKRVESFSKLKGFVKSKNSAGDVLFLPALNFLFLMGVIEYRAKTDTLEYVVGHHEAV